MSNILRRLGAEGASIPEYPKNKEGKKMGIADKLQQTPSHGDFKETVISPDADFKGSMKFKDSLRIDGSFEGEIDSDGTLFIGKSGVVKAEVKIGNIIVEGSIEGNVECQDKIELRSTAKILGDINAKRLTIAEGVNIVGKCSVSSQQQVPLSSKPEKPARGEMKKGKEGKAGEKLEATISAN